MNFCYLIYKKLKFGVRDFLSRSIYGVTVLSKFGSWGHGLVNSDSVLCVEGYPRSANSFAVAALCASQGFSPSMIGRHSHMVGQVKKAIQFGVPTMVLVRNPQDAILSYKVFDPYLSLKQCIKSYIKFYTAILELEDKVVICSFEEIIRDFQTAIDKLNDRYQMELKEFLQGEESQRECFKIVKSLKSRASSKFIQMNDQGYVPNSSKTESKELYRKGLMSPENSHLLKEAENLYEIYQNRYFS